MLKGRDLDCVVAQKVLGLDIHRTGYDWTIGPRELWDIQGSMELGNEMPYYSENMEHAWEIVEKLRSMNFIVEVACYPDTKTWLKPPYEGAPASEWTIQMTPLHYQCRIAKQDAYLGGEWISLADEVAETPALAICQSALKALEKQ